MVSGDKTWKNVVTFVIPIEQNRGKSKFEIFGFSEMLNKIVAEMVLKEIYLFQ